jgi:hypothetical protein
MSKESRNIRLPSSRVNTVQEFSSCRTEMWWTVSYMECMYSIMVNVSLPKHTFVRDLGKYHEDFLTRYYGKFFANSAYIHISAWNIFEGIRPLILWKISSNIYIYIAVKSNRFYLLNLKLRSMCFDRLWPSSDIKVYNLKTRGLPLQVWVTVTAA